MQTIKNWRSDNMWLKHTGVHVFGSSWRCGVEQSVTVSLSLSARPPESLVQSDRRGLTPGRDVSSSSAPEGEVMSEKHKYPAKRRRTDVKGRAVKGAVLICRETMSTEQRTPINSSRNTTDLKPFMFVSHTLCTLPIFPFTFTLFWTLGRLMTKWNMKRSSWDSDIYTRGLSTTNRKPGTPPAKQPNQYIYGDDLRTVKTHSDH